MVVSFEEGVRRQLRRKANVMLVERRLEVLELLQAVRVRMFDQDTTPRVVLELQSVYGQEAAPRAVADQQAGVGGVRVGAQLRLELVDASVAAVSWFEQARESRAVCSRT